VHNCIAMIVKEGCLNSPKCNVNVLVNTKESTVGEKRFNSLNNNMMQNMYVV